MSDTPPKKYCSPATATVIPSQMADPGAVAIGSPSQSQPTEEPISQPSKELTLTDTLNLSMQSVSDVITLLESLPRVGGRLPDKIVLAIGKLNGALNFLRK